jgi:hypothetical protein
MLIPFRRKRTDDVFDGSRENVRNIILTTLTCRHVVTNLAISLDHLPSLAARIAAEAPRFETPRELIDWIVRRLEREQFSLWEDAMDGSTEAFVA